MKNTQNHHDPFRFFSFRRTKVRSYPARRPTRLLRAAVLLGCLVAATAIHAQTVRLDFEPGLAMRHGDRRIEPLRAENLEPVPGLRGQAVHVPENGCLEYPADGLFNADEGTLILWMKLDRTPRGLLRNRDRDRTETGDWGELWKSKSNRTIFRSGRGMATLNSFVGFRALNVNCAPPIVKQVFGGVWHQYVFAWKKNDKIEFFLDGKRLDVRKAPDEPFRSGQTLTLGSGREYPGIDATLDELTILPRALTWEEVEAEYARFQPLRYDLLDYAVDAGKKSPCRFRIKNISAEPVTKTVDIAGTPCELSLAPGEIRELAVNVAPDRPGPATLHCAPGTLEFQCFEVYALEAGKEPVAGKSRQKLVSEIDCTKTPPEDGYTDCGTCRIVDGYRESTSVDVGAGFAYRMKIETPGRPHWLEVEYPDDAKRSYTVFVYPYNYGRLYTLSFDSIGIITGGDYPLSGEKRVKRLLFWPDSPEIAVAAVHFRFPEKHRGPALSKIRLYEQEGPLPAADVPDGGRALGLWQEDPQMTAQIWFNHQNNYLDADLEYWYVKWSRAIDYMRYMGINTWTMQVMDYFGDVTYMRNAFPNVSEHTSQAGRVPGWADLGAKMFDREGYDFFARLNPLVHRPADRWFLALAGNPPEDEVTVVDDSGKKIDTEREPYNILHPAVREAYLKAVRAYRDRFSRYEHFRGICFNEHLDFSLNNPRYGYDEYSRKTFEKDTGIRIPVATPPEAHAWLKENAWKQWTDWRCKKVTEFAAELGRVIREGGRDDLVVQLWLRADRYMPGLENWPDYDIDRTLRDIGVDRPALQELPGIVVMHTIRPDFTRIIRRAFETNEQYLLFSPEFAKIFQGEKHPTLNVFRHANMELYTGLKTRKDFFKPFWHPAGWNLPENLCRGFATSLPPTKYALEAMTHSLAEYDLETLFHGWWGNPENGEHEAFRTFYTSYRNIPSGKYDMAEGTNDPVAVRVGDAGFYLVNREGYPVELRFQLDGKPVARKLAGSEVYVQKTDARPVITEVRAVVPEEEIDRLRQCLETLHDRLKTLEADDANGTLQPRFKSGLKYLLSQAEAAMREGRYSRVRHLMLTHVARTVLEETK